MAEVEKNTKKQSKTYTKLSEQAQTIAGITGTRLELRTTTPEGVAVRRWVIVFSREHLHYVVAAAAPENEFEQYAADFNAMIASVALEE